MQPVLSWVFFILLLVWQTKIYYVVSLTEPTSHTLTNGGKYTMIVNYCDFTVDDEFSWTSRCYCWDDDGSLDCSIPGPTLVVYNGTSFDLTIINNMTGEEACTTCHDHPKDPDITNLHTHGLHVDSNVDDVFLNISANGDSHTFNFEILSNHYPGSMWYHAHWHGSVSYQLMGGLFGMLIVKNDQESNSDYQDSNLYEMKSHIIEVHWLWGYDSDDCDCEGSDWSNFKEELGSFRMSSACFTWCYVSRAQRNTSGNPYDLQLTNTDSSHYNTDSSGFTNGQYWMVNGQFEPTLSDTWYVDEWRILKFLGAQTEHVVQFDFNPLVSDGGCQFYLLGRDGVYFEHGHRNLSASPYYGYFMLIAGGRADIAMKCSDSGTYSIELSEDDLYDWMDNLSRAQNTINGSSQNTFLFEIVISAADLSDSAYTQRVSDLPSSYPEYPYYLQSLLNNTAGYVVNKECPCYGYEYNTSETEVTWETISPTNWKFTEGECGFQFSKTKYDSTTYHTVNLRLFTSDMEPDYKLNFGEIYQFYGYLNGHPYHQHVNHFQITTDINDGFLGEKGDWFDTFVTDGDVTFRTVTLDFDDCPVVVHCHNLWHEDSGMMSYMYILDEDTDTDDLNCGTYPTPGPTTAPTSCSSARSTCATVRTSRSRRRRRGLDDSELSWNDTLDWNSTSIDRIPGYIINDTIHCDLEGDSMYNLTENAFGDIFNWESAAGESIGLTNNVSNVSVLSVDYENDTSTLSIWFKVLLFNENDTSIMGEYLESSGFLTDFGYSFDDTFTNWFNNNLACSYYYDDSFSFGDFELDFVDSYSGDRSDSPSDDGHNNNNEDSDSWIIWLIVCSILGLIVAVLVVQQCKMNREKSKKSAKVDSDQAVSGKGKVAPAPESELAIALGNNHARTATDTATNTGTGAAARTEIIYTRSTDV